MLTKTFLELRKKIIEKDFSHLNPMQRKAVMHTTGPLLILAGAGSGKTSVLINRIVNLIRYGSGSDSDEIPFVPERQHIDAMEKYLESGAGGDYVKELCKVDPVRPDQILAITFTNKAAAELKTRLTNALGVNSEHMWALTFHSACLRILRKNIHLLGFEASFTIYDNQDSERALKFIIEDFGIDDKNITPKSVLNVISDAKNNMLSPKEFEKRAEGYPMNNVAQIYEEYQKLLLRSNAVDFDDMIMHTVNILKDYPEVRQFYQNKFRHVLVDEYQDTNHAQYMLSSLLTGEEGNICVVGDDDQSIYRFRGANIRNILDFESQYKSVEVVFLEQNYRSSSSILAVANSVIKNNHSRKSKKLWTAEAGGTKPVLHTSLDNYAEGAYIANEILTGYGKGKRLSDFAVLYRMNAISNSIEQVLTRNSIPYKVIGGAKFFDREEVKDMLSYLCLIHNTADDLRLRRIINVPSRKIGDTTVSLISQIAESYNISMFEVIEHVDNFPELSKAKERLREFYRMITDMREYMKENSISELYEKLLDETHYIDHLLIHRTEKADIKIENIRELQSNIVEYENRTEEPSLFGFLDEVALITDLDNLNDDSDAVLLMSIHSSKGLEFDTVFIAGVEESIFPSYQSSFDPEGIEEERRLFYVAATRAKRKLFLLHSKSRMLFGRTNQNLPSRFLEEIPEHLIDAPTRSFVRDYDDDYRPAAQTKTVVYTPQAKPKVPSIPYAVGDKVKHKVFGVGAVIGLTPMGGDTLMEIEFDLLGKKKLLYNTAYQYIVNI